MTTPNIERSVADAILAKEKEVTICGRKYKVAPPTPATLIMASAYVAELPTMSMSENILAEVLTKAKDAQAIGKVLATLIMGAKLINQHRKIRRGLFRKQDEFEWLSNYLLENYTIKEITNMLTQRLAQMEIGDFFGLTTSLSAVSITKRTKEVETASGE